MLLRPLLTSILLVVLSSINAAATVPEYREYLLLRPLPLSSLLASFTFKANTPVEAFDSQNFKFFPRSLAQILQHAHTKELHLRFSWGRWDSNRWGERPRGGSKEGGTGVELWAWVEAESEEQADAHWKTLTNTLSGLFCASLNFIDSTRTLRPVLSFEPQGHVGSSESRNLHLLHGTLAGEVVCTENLTPFLKLLPCKGKAGISTLLDGHKLFDATWQSMAIDVRQVCTGGKKQECNMEMEQTVDMALSLERALRSQNDPIPRPIPLEELKCDPNKYYSSYGDTCFPVQGPSSPAFNLSSIFGRSLDGPCPFMDQSKRGSEPLCFNVPPERRITAISTGKFQERPRNGLKCFTLPDGAPIDFTVDEEQTMSPESWQQPWQQSLVSAERTLSGYGQQHGGIRTVLKNLSPDKEFQVTYFEPMPWFMRVFTHTLKADVVGADGRPLAVDGQQLIKKMINRPAIDRQGASHLELLLSIPAASTVTLTYDFEKSILRYSEYPPDANRGFNVPAAVVRVVSPIPGNTKSQYVRTTSLLLYLPTPDFSMPYNVIILSSTVIALAFGNIFNLLVRRFVAKSEAPAGGRLRQLIKHQVARLKARLATAKSKKE